jgi:Raf kinase inhibitor-like YbhB/YbcL family protein
VRVLAALLAVSAVTGCGSGGGAGSGLERGSTVAGFEFTDASAVKEGEPIAARYTCDGENVPPALAWTGVPDGAKELALVLEDPDAPSGTFTHWLLYRLDAATTELSETRAGWTGYAPLADEGKNDFGKVGYGGPCPPRGETHRYVFRLLALNDSVELEQGADRAAFDDAVSPHVLAEARLTATYARG